LVRAAVRTSRRLSIWSVGSSTGEEAYTIAILLHQVGLDARVYGQDISRRCVAAARRGVYAESSFRATPDEIRRAFFQERPDGWHVVDAIRQTCHFGQVNLLDERSPPIGRGDVIFCRNVLIYFDDRARKAAVERLYRRLNPGGILLLGHSESLLNVPTAFELLHLKDDLVYRKPPRLAWRP
ncbi:MAG: protein-glutamate O-methyltransferase CheR, partial [Polyangiaceae bacterium]|nr:protein-glutamate O-methyltransferase CheR [Polyangiaceae bacterium]